MDEKALLSSVQQMMDAQTEKIEQMMNSQSTKMELLIENQVTQRLNLLEEGQQEILERLVPRSRVDDLEEEVRFLKSIVRQITEDVQTLKKAN